MDSKPTILIVDDEPAIRMGLAATIGRHGYTVVTAKDGSDGLEKAREISPDVIVSDVMMPGVNGFEMRKQLSLEPTLASIPFIFLTARTASEDRVAGIRSGADDYVTKPFVTEELVARIEAVLRRVQTERERGREQVKQEAQEEMETLRRELMQNFRHELRTPLSNIIMSLEMAVNHKFNSVEEQGDFIKIARSSSERLESLVSDIILLTDMDHDQVNRVRQTINLENHILAPIKKRLARYVEKDLKLKHNVLLDGEIKAPRREFTQAIVHLVDNAFKFSPDQGNVLLTIKSTANGGAVIEVEDEGKGIDPELREKVFERFYQASNGDNREQQGLGVGLTIARAIFRSLGGDVVILERETGCCVLASFPDLQPDDIFYE
ncbi:MAG: response regulator [Anaerolineales bacterium]